MFVIILCIGGSVREAFHGFYIGLDRVQGSRSSTA